MSVRPKILEMSCSNERMAGFGENAVCAPKPVLVPFVSRSRKAAQRSPQNTNNQSVKQGKSGQPSDKTAQRVSEPPAKEKPAASESNGPNTAEQDHGNKGKD
jgi:hypothetical protein